MCRQWGQLRLPVRLSKVRESAVVCILLRIYRPSLHLQHVHGVEDALDVCCWCACKRVLLKAGIPAAQRQGLSASNAFASTGHKDKSTELSGTA